MSIGTLNFTSFTRRFALPHWRFYGIGLLLLAVVNFINLEIPQLAKRVINALGLQNQTVNLSDYRTTALSIVGLGLAIIIIRSLSRIALFWPGRKLESDTKSYFFGRTLSSTQEFFLRHGMGDLISRMSNDIGQLRAFYAFGVLQIANVIFLFSMTISKMAQVHSLLTVFALTPLALMLVISRLAMPRMHTISRANQNALGELTNRVTESFVNVHVIQANAAADAFATRIEKANEEVYTTNMRLVFIRTLVFPLMSCLSGLSQLIVLFYGGHEVIAGRLTVGDILSFNVYIALLTFPLTAIGLILALRQRAMTAIERLSEIETSPREVAQPMSPKETAAPSALLHIQSLSFAFPQTAGTQVLQDIHLSLQPGRRLGLFGPIGSGKSTLFQLMTRLYDPPEGTIFLEGQDILSLDPRALRKKVGFASQNVHLFSASIRENLCFGLSQIPSADELHAAAAGAQILNEILAFKDGWETQIGEKGLRLSGGQKQRLALARLFLRQAELLLLDDVLSAVDHRTETRLIDYIYSRGNALIIASHRGSALQSCDEILILEAGRIVDRGTYQELSPRQPQLVHGGG